MISVCVVNWNQAELLLDCLRSIFENPPSEELEVIVVDNGSTDGSASRVREAFPQVRLIENEENLGFGAANNQAIEASEGWAILLLNNDTLVLPGALDAMADVLRSDPRVGIVGCSQYADRDLTIRHRTAYRRFPSIPASFVHQAALFMKLTKRFPKSRFVNGLVMNYSYDDHDRAIDAAHINGACMMCRREVLDEVGLFDTNLFLFLEDTDLCQRVKKAGYRIVYTPAGTVVHFGSQSLIASGRGFKQYHYKSKCYYLEKHYGRLTRLLYQIEFAAAKRVIPRIINQEYGA